MSGAVPSTDAGSSATLSWHVRGDSAEVEIASGIDPAGSVVDDVVNEVTGLIERFETSGATVHLAAEHPADELDAVAEAVADQVGVTERRDLLQMRRTLPIEGEHPLRLGAPAITTRPFVPGVDDDAWIRVNNRAFASHPDQGREDRSTLADRMAEPWFDADGFLVADEASDIDDDRETADDAADTSIRSARDRELSGFCWTKVHPAVPGDDHGQGEPALGEIYVIGVDPRHRGEGLGPAFVIAGLDHLASLGIGTAVLYVDATNEPARRLYDRLGFTVHRRRRVYTAPDLAADTGATGDAAVIDPADRDRDGA